MRHLIFVLTALLGGQLCLALFLAFTGSDHAAFEAKEPLLAFAPAKIDQISIDDDAGNSVTLDRQDGKWAIPSFAGFPADQSRVENLLAGLAALRKGWPVAETSSAAERFKLTEKIHDRRIVLKSDSSPVQELLIGTSPSYRQVHARVGDASAIYTVEFAVYDAGAGAADWMNRNILDTPQNKIASITLGDVTIEGKDGKFTLAGLAKDEKPLADKVNALASAVAHPVFDAVQGRGKDVLSKADNPDVEVELKRTDGSVVTYKYKKDAAGGDYVFTSSVQDYLFRVAANKLDAIVGAKRDALIEAPKPASSMQQSQGDKAEPQAAPDRNDGQASHGGDAAKEHGG